MKRVAVVAAVLSLIAAPAWSKSILFMGNSFTFGANSAVRFYQPETVTDLNGPINGRTIGGVPALFKLFTKEAGLDYQVSLETQPGQGIDWHWNNRMALLDKPWDEVILQSHSTIDQAKPGDPTLLVQYTKMWTDKLLARNAAAQIYLDATWSRADLTYQPDKPWTGKPIQQMGLDIQKGYEAAHAAAPKTVAVIPVGAAFNRAFATGFADTNPYDGIEANKVNLWSFDNYHASSYGYYLHALMIFGKVTGKDPLSLGAKEQAGVDLGFSPKEITGLQQIAHDQLAAG
jgi:hypothetical protein